jgi:hypothetical protein
MFITYTLFSQIAFNTETVTIPDDIHNHVFDSVNLVWVPVPLIAPRPKSPNTVITKIL